MSRFEFHPVTREPFLQGPQPDKARRAHSAPEVSDLDTNASVSSGSGPDETSHPEERLRQEQGNRGRDEEPGFGQGA